MTEIDTIRARFDAMNAKDWPERVSRHVYLDDVATLLGALVRAEHIIARARSDARTQAFLEAAKMAGERHDRELKIAVREANAETGDLGLACAARSAAIVLAGFSLTLGAKAGFETKKEDI